MTVETMGDERYPDAKCGVCQTVTWVTDDGRVSRRAFCRAEVELIREVGVPIPDRFEHLAATIAEATPLYELCASVLEA